MMYQGVWRSHYGPGVAFHGGTQFRCPRFHACLAQGGLRTLFPDSGLVQTRLFAARGVTVGMRRGP